MFDLSSLVWSQVTKEPVLESGYTDNHLKADVGIWHLQSMALFDVRVLDFNAHLILRNNPYRSSVTLKKRKKRSTMLHANIYIPPSHHSV